jgi:hypothetical protein
MIVSLEVQVLYPLRRPKSPIDRDPFYVYRRIVRLGLTGLAIMPKRVAPIVNSLGLPILIGKSRKGKR